MHVLHFTPLHFQSCWSWVQTAKFTTQLLQECWRYLCVDGTQKSCHISALAPLEKHFTFCRSRPVAKCKVQSASCKTFGGPQQPNFSSYPPQSERFSPPVLSHAERQNRQFADSICSLHNHNLRTAVDWMHRTLPTTQAQPSPCKPRMRYARQANPTPP